MRIDWFAVIADINRNGISLYMLEAAGVVSRNKAQYYKTGGEPKHEDGESLISFWIGITGKAREQLPVMRDELSASRARVLLKS